MKGKTHEALTWETAPDFLTVEQMAGLLQIGRTAAYDAVNVGTVPSVNFGVRKTRIAKAALAKVFGLDTEYYRRDRRLQPSEA